MNKSKSISLRLAEGSVKSSNKKAVAETPPNFARKLLHYPDPKAAIDIVGEQAGLEFDAQYIAESETLKLEMDEINDNYKLSGEEIRTLKDKKSKTKPYIKAVAGDGNIESTSLKKWTGKDKALFGVVLVALISAMVMGFSNIFSNLMASGTPIFLETPILAAMLALLVPTASASLKFVTNFMDFDTTRKLYVRILNALTGAALLTWTILFAQSYAGITGGIDWGSLGESNSSGTLFVWIQLVTEMLVASSLFLALEDIYMRYCPDHFIKNPEYIQITKILAEKINDHEALREERSRKQGRIKELEAARQAFINEKIADYINMRDRYSAINNF